MPTLDRYLLREFGASVAATSSILLLVGLSGVLADVLGKIARGKYPASLLLSQMGLRLVEWLPQLLPLGLFLGLLLALGRLYRDSEVAVLAAAGVGPRRLLRPVLWLALPISAVIAAASLWLGPAALDASKQMIDAANRSLLVAGLEPGRFIEIPGQRAVVYLDGMSEDGHNFRRLFVHVQRGERVDVVTASGGELYVEAVGEERYLALHEGFRVEGVPGRSDYRVMRFARNDIRVPDREQTALGGAQQRASVWTLLESGDAADRAELHFRLGAPLLSFLLAILALPLAKNPPRAARYGALLIAVLVYLVYSNCLSLGRALLADGSLPDWLGLWWLHGPIAAAALWLFATSERARPAQRARS